MTQEPSQANTKHQQFDVFLSYQGLDVEFVKKLGTRIETEEVFGRKLSVFFAPWDIKPADNVVSRLNEGLSKARFFVLVLSPEALVAAWPVAEQAAAIYADPSGRLGRVIVAMRRPCSLPPLLRIRNYLNFVKDSNFEIEYERLASTLTGRSLRPDKGKNPVANVNSSQIPRIDIKETLIDDVKEDLFSNLFAVNYPDRIYSAPTKFYERRQVYSYFDEDIPPAFILKSSRLYSFVGLEGGGNEFAGAIENYDIQSHLTSEWQKDPDKSKWLIELLNDSFRVLSFSVGLRLDKKGKKSYFPKGVLASDKVNWKAHQKSAKRHMIKERKNEEGQTVYFIHRAVNARFILLGSQPVLRCETGRVFSRDGSNLIEGRRRSILSTRLLSRQRNLSEFDDTRFWTWLLSEDGKVINLDSGRVTVTAKPISVSIQGGIYGDVKQIPEDNPSPPDLTQEVPEVDIDTNEPTSEIEELQLEEEFDEREDSESDETEISGEK